MNLTKISFLSLVAVVHFTFSLEICAEDSIRRVGYLKDGARNRIFTFAYKAGTQETKIQSHARALLNTPGQMTAAYYFPEGSKIPADGITLAGSVYRANSVLYDSKGLSKWRYAYLKALNGSETFVDCQATPNDDLCRK